MSDIFLSYTSEDRERVRPLVEALRQEGWEVFWDRGIPVGKTWHEVLEEKLEATRSLVVVWSKHSIKSKWVREEAEEGIYMKLPLFPVVLDGVRPPLGFRSVQAADLSAWDGEVTSPLFRNLARDIKNALGQPSSTKVVEPTTPGPEPVQPTPPEPQAPEPPKKVETQPGPEFTNSLGMTFVLIPAGTFQMGSGTSPEETAKRYGGEADRYRLEHPQHQVTLSRHFYLQTTAVTQGQWEKVMGDNPSHFKEGGDDCPVEQVAWDDVQEFLKKLNRTENTEKYRLPTEAEWEYACRAGSTTEWCFGDEAVKLGEYAWYWHNSQGKTQPVGKKSSNAWGLYDMHGNVWEWCQDWHGKYHRGPVTVPQGPDTGKYRVLRGGSWLDNAGDARSAGRRYSNPDIRFYSLGFRVARAL